MSGGKHAPGKENRKQIIYIYILKPRPSSLTSIIPLYNPTAMHPDRGILSSAHMLAIDAKHLLDVIDKIRLNYHHVNMLILYVSKFKKSSLSWR